ncbi:MAG: M48 family metalloprotease [Acidobacteria bacterium]|nr:M48 family metalloprotease [Acidobacteriota bacterium]MCG2816065.1 M48 family metalloprotease [Candidatus Aminicenantes bacterium]
MKKRDVFTTIAAVLILLMGGCSMIEEGAGKLSDVVGKADSAVQTAKTIRRTFGDISEEEEYYIGRSVAALVLSRYPASQNESLNTYLNTVGQAVAYYSDRPETYAGYHFLLLDTDEVNALSAPGGFIFITKGLLKRCRNEEMLGCILAHEIGHVASKHGLRAIKNSRLIEAFQILGESALDKYGSGELNSLVNIFDGALNDITEKLIEKGYDRKYEYEADALAVLYAARIGYDPQGLTDFLQTMVKDEGTGPGWFSTHPAASDRIKRAEGTIRSLASRPAEEAARTNRFAQAVRGLK